MKGWKQFSQKRTLKTSIRQGKRVNTNDRKSEQKGLKYGILFIFPEDPAIAKSLVAPVREWLRDFQGGTVKAVVPAKAEELAKQLKPGAKIISFTEEDATRSKVPTRDFRRRIMIERATVSVLLAEDFSPFSDVLFALSRAKLKACLGCEKRNGYSDLLLNPKEAHAPGKKVQLLLQAITTFASNIETTSPKSETSKKAVDSFAK